MSKMTEPKSDCCGNCNSSGYVPVLYPEYDSEGYHIDDKWEWEGCPDCGGRGHKPCKVKEVGDEN